MTHTQKLLSILDDRKMHSNYELFEETKIWRISARIHDLKAKGYEIEGHHDEIDRQKYWYQLMRTPEEILNGQQHPFAYDLATSK